MARRCRPSAPPGHRGLGRVLRRGVALAVLVSSAALPPAAAGRLFERADLGLRRPWTPRITQVVCPNAFRLMGLGIATEGYPCAGAGRWSPINAKAGMDIFALSARKRIYFVSKGRRSGGWAGSAGWRGATGHGLSSPRERRRDHGNRSRSFRARLADQGTSCCSFPEGTSTDGRRVLPLQADAVRGLFRMTPCATLLRVQPVAWSNAAPRAPIRRAYGWWGAMGFAPHLRDRAGPGGRQGGVTVDPITTPGAGRRF